MQDHSGNPSYRANPHLGDWQRLADLVQVVETIMEALDDLPRLNEHNDGTAHTFVVQLDKVLKQIPECTPKGYTQTTRKMANHVRAAGRHLNAAAELYRNNPSKKYDFQTRLHRGRECLEEALDIWQAILAKL